MRQRSDSTPGPKPAVKRTGGRNALKPPRHLTKDAKRVWRRLYAALDAAGLVKDLDADLLAMTAADVAFMELAYTQLGEELTQADAAHKGTPRKSPLWTVYCQARDRAFSGLRELGMTPGVRAQRNITPEEEPTSIRDLLNWAVAEDDKRHQW